MTYLDQWNLAHDPDFLHRIHMAYVDSAIDVMAEDDQTVGHDRRFAYALAVLGAHETKLPGVAEVLCGAVDTLSSSSSDADIKTALASIWDALSGVPST
jgi:hypothetical protein